MLGFVQYYGLQFVPEYAIFANQVDSLLSSAFGESEQYNLLCKWDFLYTTVKIGHNNIGYEIEINMIMATSAGDVGVLL